MIRIAMRAFTLPTARSCCADAVDGVSRHPRAMPVAPAVPLVRPEPLR